MARQTRVDPLTVPIKILPLSLTVSLTVLSVNPVLTHCYPSSAVYRRLWIYNQIKQGVWPPIGFADHGRGLCGHVLYLNSSQGEVIRGFASYSFLLLFCLSVSACYRSLTPSCLYRTRTACIVSVCHLCFEFMHYFKTELHYMAFKNWTNTRDHTSWTWSIKWLRDHTLSDLSLSWTKDLPKSADWLRLTAAVTNLFGNWGKSRV